MEAASPCRQSVINLLIVSCSGHSQAVFIDSNFLKNTSTSTVPYRHNTSRSSVIKKINRLRSFVITIILMASATRERHILTRSNQFSFTIPQIIQRVIKLSLLMSTLGICSCVISSASNHRPAIACLHCPGALLVSILTSNAPGQWSWDCVTPRDTMSTIRRWPGLGICSPAALPETSIGVDCRFSLKDYFFLPIWCTLLSFIETWSTLVITSTIFFINNI